MTDPQAGIFVEGTPFHYHLEYTLHQQAGAGSVCRALHGLIPGGGNAPNVVVAFGAQLWRKLVAESAPSALKSFTTLEGPDGYTAPATQRDLWLWIHGPDHGENLALALEIHRRLTAVATVRLDQSGFVFRDSRDLTGFVDGSANPRSEAAVKAAVIPGGEPGAGGSHVLTQRWVHDLEAFGALAVADQERVIGRTKADSIELEGDAMPPDSHVSRTDVKQDGTALKIYRRSVPWGTASEHGLYFIAFACELTRFDVLLRHMYGLTEDGVTDQLLKFSQPVTGSYWFAPPQNELLRLLG